MCEGQGAPLVRINPREPQVSSANDVGIAMGALDALRRLHQVLQT
jgi:hypothetical protein